MEWRWSRCCIAKMRARRPTNERALLKEIGARAEHYYASAQELMPLIDKESRPALWVLVAIYHALLKRIERADFDVFSRRVLACRRREAARSWLSG